MWFGLDHERLRRRLGLELELRSDWASDGDEGLVVRPLGVLVR